MVNDSWYHLFILVLMYPSLQSLAMWVSSHTHCFSCSCSYSSGARRYRHSRQCFHLLISFHNMRVICYEKLSRLLAPTMKSSMVNLLSRFGGNGYANIPKSGHYFLEHTLATIFQMRQAFWRVTKLFASYN